MLRLPCFHSNTTGVGPRTVPPRRLRLRVSTSSTGPARGISRHSAKSSRAAPGSGRAGDLRSRGTPGIDDQSNDIMRVISNGKQSTRSVETSAERRARLVVSYTLQPQRGAAPKFVQQFATVQNTRNDACASCLSGRPSCHFTVRRARLRCSALPRHGYTRKPFMYALIFGRGHSPLRDRFRRDGLNRAGGSRRASSSGLCSRRPRARAAPPRI